MRPPEVTPEQIIEAGETLQAAGRTITGFALRARIGGGNPARLKRVWEEHVAAHADATAAPVAELPAEVAAEVGAMTQALSERLAALAVALNNTATMAAERRVTDAMRAAAEQRGEAERAHGRRSRPRALPAGGRGACRSPWRG
jgi:colicin import membrane protein